MTPTSEVVARLEQAIKLGTATGARGQHPTNIYNVAADALSLISSLVAERDAGAETALRLAGKYADAADRVEALTTRALTAERLLAEARAGLTRIASNYEDGQTLSGTNCADIASEVLASIGGGNG